MPKPKILPIKKPEIDECEAVFLPEHMTLIDGTCKINCTSTHFTLIKPRKKS